MRRCCRWPRSLLAAFVLRPGVADAWSPEGHERIGRIAEALLTGKHKDQVRSMMHSDVIDTSDWEKNMTQKYPETDPLHWHRQDPEWSCGSRGGLGGRAGTIRCDNHGAEKGSLFCALAYFFEHFSHDALLKEYPEPKEPIGTPESLVVLQKIPSSELKPAYFLRWLVILVGDLHQPLHWLHEHNYGRDIQVIYKGETIDLLTLWEDTIPKNMVKLKGGYHPDRSDKDYDSRSPSWQNKNPQELFREWAKDAAEKLCTEVYAPMTVNHADGTRVESPFSVTEEMFGKWVKLAEDLTELGGERLAFVLNDLIEHKRHKDAHADGRGLPSVKVAVGTETIRVPSTATAAKTKSVAPTKPGSADDIVDNTATKDVEEEDSPEDEMKDIDIQEFTRTLKILERRRSQADAAKNGVIAIIVVPTLIVLLNWHQRLGGVSLWKIKQHLKM